MEAMFDRMDAIGKSMLGLTIQCAQCHNHKYDPLTQEEYYRMFAFLNNAHEANIAVYTPDEQQTRAEIFRCIQRDRGRVAARAARLAGSGWRSGRSARRRPAGVDVVSPAVDEISTGGEKYLPLADGSMLAQGYAPTKHTREDDGQGRNCQAITAFRLELLNDPNLPLGGPGRSIRGTGALTEFEVEAAPADAPKTVERSKSVRPPPTSTRPKRCSRPSSTTKAASAA